MSQALVRRALESTLKTYADAEPLTVAWENVEFTPPVGMYLRSFVLPALTISPDLQRAGRSYAGVYQVSIVAPTGTGSGAAEIIAAEISAAFDPDTPITVGGVTVWITQPLSTSAPIPERDRFVIPCSIPYAASVY